jgi:tetratricopeptide (TPR) repeat protein
VKAKRDPHAAAPISRRRWWFRVGALLFPILLLLLIELALRVFGYGYEPHFFLSSTRDGVEVLTDNAKFGWRFFPPLMARTPEPVVFNARKDPGACRIFVFGESAAMGDPDPAVGFPRMLQTMLEAKFPREKFEVINVAMTAINSHVMREIAKDCARLDGDFWVIYAGNNEVVGPFGGGTVFGPQVPPLGWIRFTIWFKTTRIGQLLSNLRPPPDADWEGMEMFLKQQVRSDDPRLPKVYANFRANLSDVVKLGTRSGAKVILSTVAVNLRDSPPFASQHRRALSVSEQAQWNERWTNASVNELAGAWTAARTNFLEADKVAGGNDAHAELHFHLARCAEAIGQREDALREFNAAKEFDTLRFRADDAINGIIRSLSNAPVRLVDATKNLAAFSSNGIPGAECFYEHVHFTFEGTYALARAVFGEILQELPVETQRAANVGVPTREECAQRLCWNEWKQHEVFSEMTRRLQQPPFTAQFGHETRDAYWEHRLASLSIALTPRRMRELASQYDSALAHDTNDWVLHEDHAKLLTDLGDATNALAEWGTVIRLLPHDPTPFFYFGSVADSLGMTADAVAAFREALRRDPNMVEARNALGLLLIASGHTDAGKRELSRAIQIRPRFTEARINLGQTLAKEGKLADAREQYETALRIDTNSAAAHLSLGKLLSSSNDKAGAVEHYREAVRIEPRNAIAHFDLANVLTATAPTEAIEHYRAAVAIETNFADAHYSLALELAKANNVRESLPHFARFVKLKPDDANGHLNYGVALAKTRQFVDAAREFRETLRIQPNNARAREFLEKTQSVSQ